MLTLFTSLRLLLLPPMICAALALTGCATGQAEYYAAETARHAAEGERWAAMGRIAESGDVTAKAVALAVMGQTGGAGQQQVTAAPRSAVADLLQFAGIVLPAAIQGYGIHSQTQLGMRQSDNGARQNIAAAEYGFKGADSTNSAFLGIAGKIQAAGAVTMGDVTKTYTSNPVTTTTTSANPVTTTSTSNPVTTTTSTANPITTTTANPVTTTTSSNNPATTTDRHDVAPMVTAPAQ